MNGNQRTEGRHKIPHIINQPNMLGYQKLSPVITIIVIMTVERKHRCESKLFNVFKRVDVKSMQWWAGTWAEDDSGDGGDEERNGTATTTEQERSCSSREKRKAKQKRKTAEMRVLHGDISSQVLMRSKLDKASWSAHIVLNTAMRNAMMIMMVW